MLYSMSFATMGYFGNEVTPFGCGYAKGLSDCRIAFKTSLPPDPSSALVMSLGVGSVVNTLMRRSTEYVPLGGLNVAEP
jgi:hypothetical protein